ncbi:MAG TPA: ABC transporter permease [bacterium]|nr:ABC transporter permease [bacterium]
MKKAKPSGSLCTEKTIVGSATVLFFLILWQLNSSARLIDPQYISSPSQVLMAGIETIRSRAFFLHWSVSLAEFLVGMIFAVLFGVILGCVIGRFKTASDLLDPAIMALYSMPRVTIIPLIVIWFGIGMISKEVVVFLGAVFPILINAAAGIKQVDPGIIRAAKSFGASESEIFSKVLLPGAFPYIIAGIRLGIGRGLIGFIIAEMYAATKGVGYALMDAGEVMKTDELLFYAATVILFGYALIFLFGRIEVRYTKHLADMRSLQ